MIDVIGVPPGNNAPVAKDDDYSVNENATLTVAADGVLINDTDADNDSLTAILVSDVSNGALTLNADGSFVYVPTAGYSGSDSFTYVANDGFVNSTAATVSITVEGVGFANFTYTPSDPEVGESIVFNACPSGGCSGTYNYTWDFGDNGTGSGIIITHTYTAEGDYSVNLTVNNTNLTDSIVKVVSVTDGSITPPPTPSGDSVLDINSVDVDEDEPKPDDEVEITVEIENDGDEDIEDIEFLIQLLDEDGNVVEDEEGDDLEEDEDFDLDEGDEEEFTYTFKMPADARDGEEYTVYVEACYEDEDGTEQCISDSSETIEIQREKHDVQIYSATLGPSTITCSDNFDVNVGVKNIGQKDEDVVVKVISDELGISESRTFELEAYDDEDYKKSLSFALDVPEDIAEGTYTIKVIAEYDDGDEEETISLQLTKGACVSSAAVETEEPESDILLVDSEVGTAEITGMIAASKIKDFEDSFEYLILLSILGVLALGLLVFLIGYVIIKKKKQD